MRPSRRTILRIVIAMVLIISVFVLKPFAETFWASFRDFTSPKYYDFLLDKWSNKSVDFLIDKLGHPAPTWEGVASNILARRKDISKEEKLIRIIESDRSNDRRSSALGVLFSWDEKQAQEISMGILQFGNTHPLFDSALGKLSYRKYEPAYSYVVKLATQPDGYKNGSVSLLEKYGRVEALPVLQGMLQKVRSDDPIIFGVYKDTILNAIRSIKEKNGIPN